MLIVSTGTVSQNCREIVESSILFCEFCRPDFGASLGVRKSLDFISVVRLGDFKLVGKVSGVQKYIGRVMITFLMPNSLNK